MAAPKHFLQLNDLSRDELEHVFDRFYHLEEVSGHLFRLAGKEIAGRQRIEPRDELGIAG